MEGQHRAAPLSQISRILPALAASVLSTISCATAAELAWKPEKAIEIIATNAPGGGSDRIIRMMTKILQQRKDLTVPVTVVNKPGGGGSVSYAYLNQHPGDGHYMGQVRLLAVASPKRLPGVLADVPTWREQGYDAVVSNWRIMVGPRGMTPGQVAYWENALRRFGDSEEWRKELEANFWTHELMGAGETNKFLERENVQARAFLIDLGLAK